MNAKSSGPSNPVAPQSVESLKPDKGPLDSEKGQNPAAEADTLPSEGPRADSDKSEQAGKQGKRAPVTPNEVMNEQVSPQDEQGDRPQSDQPHIGG